MRAFNTLPELFLQLSMEVFWEHLPVFSSLLTFNLALLLLGLE